jgi:crossover junction endodeoxyribonuclease RusA
MDEQKMKTYVSVLLPWPDSALSPNSRNRWAKIKAVKAAREMTEALLAGTPFTCPTGAVSVSYNFYPPTRRAFDIDGLVSRIKAYQDQIFEHLGADDRQIVALFARRCEILKNGAVEITVQEANQE